MTSGSMVGDYVKRVLIPGCESTEKKPFVMDLCSAHAYFSQYAARWNA
jgi:hypothetical protein